MRASLKPPLRRLDGNLTLCCLLALVPLPLLAATAAAVGPKTSWAAPQIRAVTAAGLMDATDAASFRPDDVLTAQSLENLVFALKLRLAPAEPEPPPEGPTVTVPPAAVPTTATTVPSAPKQVARPDKPVTMAQLDARLVEALGLGPAAGEFLSGARAAGLKVPARFGTEVVARLLALRLNHPASQDSLELLPSDPATRAEAAYSAAQILAFSGDETAAVQVLADTFALPVLTDWQKQILATAFARIGMPYVWGGTQDGPEIDLGVSARGGYDCSGFIWRVYKLQSYPDEGGLASVLRGRTTYAMSGEVPRSKRIGLLQLEPADVVFFGAKGPKSKPAQIDHMGIYIGDGWFIQSSDYGVALARLDGWYLGEFAWARRPLAEAGLVD